MHMQDRSAVAELPRAADRGTATLSYKAQQIDHGALPFTLGTSGLAAVAGGPT
jgi:hypothetical protein